MATVSERAREFMKKLGMTLYSREQLLQIIEQALLAERRLALDFCVETAERMRDGAQQRSDDLTSFSPGHDRWAAAQLDILAQALRAAAEKEV